MDKSFLEGLGDCTSVQTATLRAIIVWQERGLVCFGSLLCPYVGVVIKVVGVGEGARSSRTLVFILVTLRNRKESSKSLTITTNICQSRTQLFVASRSGGK